MSKCAVCKTTWTTQGMLLCPVCGARVEGEGIGTQTTRIRRPTAILGAKNESKANGTAVLTAPAAVRTPEPIAPMVAPPIAPPAPVQVAPPPAPPPAPAPVSTTPTKSIEPVSPFVMDSVVLPLPRPASDVTQLPFPARPLSAPLVLGVLSLVAAVLLPVTLAFENNRVLGILGFCASGFFVPFGPIAWMVGLSAEKRRRDQGLRPEPRVLLGRMLGQAGTLLLVTEVTLALLLVAGLRLSGELPGTFWVSRHF